MHNLEPPHSIPARCACRSPTFHTYVSIRSGSLPLHFPFLVVSDGDAEYATKNVPASLVEAKCDLVFHQ